MSFWKFFDVPARNIFPDGLDQSTLGVALSLRWMATALGPET